MQHRKHRRMRIKRWLLNSILLGIIVFSSTMLVVILIGYLRDRASYAEARTLAVTTPAPVAAALMLAPTDPAAASSQPSSPTPPEAETPPIAVDFPLLHEKGKHVRGWLYNEGTAINYPVVYYTNNTYYLTHDYTGKHSSAGALFFDTRVQKELTADNLIVYGHHMKDGSMFKSLMQYQKQSYYNEHPVMYLLTEGGNYRVDLFSGRFTDSAPALYPVWFSSPEEKASFVRGALSGSDFTALDTEYRPDSRIITLVTCAYSNYIDDAKYQVLGWLTPIG